MKLQTAKYVNEILIREGDALIVVDVQNDFLPGGALATQAGDPIVRNINQTIQKFTELNLPVIFTQDWHPKEHYSFAIAHEGKQPFDEFHAEALGPVLWPDHCVQGSKGAEFAPDLNTKPANAIIRKGYNKEIDSYSGFLENDQQTETGLDGYLKDRNVKRIFIAGLAFDYCVFFTAVDGACKDYEVYTLLDLTQPVGSPEGRIEKAQEEMEEKSVNFAESAALKFEEVEA